MTSKVLVAALACLIPCLAAAQQSAGAQAQGNASASASVSKDEKNVSADGGTATNAVLSGSLDAKKAKPGDPVTAKTTEPSKTSDDTTLPKGTKLMGHVTEAKAAGSGEAQSTLGFVFDRAVLKDGREVPIHTTVRALAAAEGAADASADDAMGRMSGAGHAAGGAAAGGGGLVGGVTGTAGGALGGAGRVAGGATGAVGSTVGASGRALTGSAGAVGGVNGQGMLSSGSQGVFGLKGMNLTQNVAGEGSVVTSAGKNLRLESGTRMLLSVEGSATRSAPPAAQ